MYPHYVVVDTIDGYVFKNDSSGTLFDEETAHEFADERNRERKPGHATYMVFKLLGQRTETYDNSNVGRPPR